MPGFDWNQLRAFLATVESGSLSGAARLLGQTQPTLSRQIATLEQDLDLLLFERVGKRLVLTESGQRLAEQARLMGEAADRVALAASGQSQAESGLVRVTCSDMASSLLLPALEKLQREAPGIVVEIISSNTVDDLMRREADIAVRHVQPNQPDLIARRCPDGPVMIYGASALLDRIGRPPDISTMPLVGFSQAELFIAELARRGIVVTKDNFRFYTDSSPIMWDIIRRGLALGVMMREVVDGTPGVELAFPDMTPILAPIWLVAHRELHGSRRIRLVFDALADALITERGG